MHGKVLKLVREVYSTVKATVRTEQGLTDFFECKLGVRQGCILSPRLYYIHKQIGNNAEEVRVQRNLCG